MTVSNIDNLIFLSGLNGHHLIGIQRWSKGFRIVYHCPKKAGMFLGQNVRDKIDYKYILDSWIKRGKVYSEWNEDFDALVKSEITKFESDVE